MNGKENECFVNQNEITLAIHWWLCDNCNFNKAIFGQIRPLLIFIFNYINSIYAAIEKFHLSKAKRLNLGIESNGKLGIIIHNELSPSNFFQIRGILALVGDLYLILIETKKLSWYLDNKILFKLIKKYLPKFKAFRYARNFFAHFNERIGVNRIIHGVTGEFNLSDIGIKFGKNSIGNFYLIFNGNKIYYHDKQKFEQISSPKTLLISKNSLEYIFSLGRDLYDLFTSHKIHQTNYKSSKKLYI
ncbi:MAG: hypothetical protein ACP6IY_16665 [Promethearchaeia archaeon]